MAEFTVAPLTPAAFLRRLAVFFAERTAVVDGDRQSTYREFATRCAALARALGVEPPGRVPALCTNSHVLLELHQPVPASGAVQSPINVRLAPDAMVYVLFHSGARVLITTPEFADTAKTVAAEASVRLVDPSSYEELLSSAPTAGRVLVGRVSSLTSAASTRTATRSRRLPRS